VSDEPGDALARAAEEGIHRLRSPTPFAVGRVNTYLIEDEPLTLVDSGPNSGKALDELERQLRELGRRIEDLGLLVITHQHIDHLGLVDVIARRSRAEVAAIEPLASYLGRYSQETERDDEFAEAVMLRHGIAEDVVHALRAVSRAFRGWGAGTTVSRPLRNGEHLELRDRTLEALHRPGHSPTDTVFWDENRRILVAGDHLLKDISSNPLVTRRPGSAPDADNRLRALVSYLESLRATREMPAEIVLTGHGEPVTDHVDLIDRRFGMHERRAGRILRLIENRPSTAYEIAQTMWGDVAVTQAYLTLSEVLGHLDLLEAAGRVRPVDRDGTLVFEAAEG
jgi:glyoxylase-like metal-dependent hydrolase (beta-lactamase superfamily II)